MLLALVSMWFSLGTRSKNIEKDHFHQCLKLQQAGACSCWSVNILQPINNYTPKTTIPVFTKMDILFTKELHILLAGMGYYYYLAG